MTNSRKLLGVAAIAAAVTGMAGCDSAVGLGAKANGSVAFSVQKVNTSPLGLTSSPPNEFTSGGHTIVLSSATMTASELELKGPKTEGTGSDSARSKFETGPITLELPVHGGATRDITTQIPAGTYDKFEMEIRSVRLQGTYDGSPFDVTVLVNSELEARLQPPVVVTDPAAKTAIKVALDLQSWFTSSAGGLLDPRQAQSNPIVAAALRANIRNSFEASEDEEHERELENHGG